MSLVVTHSDLKAFLTCRRQWYWQYVSDYQKPEKRTGPLALGIRVHAAIEQYYANALDPVEVFNDLSTKAIDDSTYDVDAPPWELDQLYKDTVVGRRCVQNHQNWLEEEGEDAPYEVAGVEQTVEADIMGGDITLRGKVDVLFREIDTGFLFVNDLKTAAKKTVREEFERSYQHNVYMAALRLANPGEFIQGAMYTVMYKTARTGSVERFKVPGSTRMADNKLRQIEAICREMLHAIDRIENDGVANAYPTPQDACRWCAFRHPCELLDESSVAAREMLEKDFTRGKRYARYTP